jgi:Metallo-beta-lactamase superfamily
MRKLDGPILENPPLTDEVEVSVFGPGFGECVVVHLTGQSWLVVDSCIDARAKEPAALVYFEKIGIDAAKDVRFVISTHWHDDHIRGIGRVFGTCEVAKFVCAHGLESEQFKNLISLYSRYFPSGGPGVEEMRQVISILKVRRRVNSLVSPEFVSAGTILYEPRTDMQILVKALSPSSEACLASVAKFAEDLVPKEGQRRSAVPVMEPNDLAIVLTVRVAGLRFLLGSDLEEDGRAGLGWQAVLERFREIDNSHEGFKISHHGSETGHHPEVWPNMMKYNAWAALTPLFAWKKAVTLATRCRADMLSIVHRVYHRAKINDKIPSPEKCRSKAIKRNERIYRRGRRESGSHPA